MSLSTAEKRALLTSEMDDLIRTYGENADDWPIGQAKLGERILNGIRKLDAQDELERSRAARADVIRAAVADTKNHENGFGGGPTTSPLSVSVPL